MDSSDTTGKLTRGGYKYFIGYYVSTFSQTIEEQVALIETTLNQKEIMDVLTQGNKVLANLQKEVNVEKF